MASLPRLVLFVEGDGDREAVPILVRCLLTKNEGWGHLVLDSDPFVVGGIGDLTKEDAREWLRYLNAARTSRKNLGAVLLLLDGDAKSVRKEPFCAALFAARLAEWARAAGAGKVFSVACAFALLEYESWIIACAGRLSGVALPDGRDGVEAGTVPPEVDLETTLRGAKEWLDRHMKQGYKPTRDQAAMTQLMINHLDAIQDRGMRSFRRLEPVCKADYTERGGIG
jgi:Domain of unknown function (DUF4276)